MLHLFSCPKFSFWLCPILIFSVFFFAQIGETNAQVIGGGKMKEIGKKTTKKDTTALADSTLKDTLNVKSDSVSKDSTKKTEGNKLGTGQEEKKDSISYGPNTVGFLYRSDLLNGLLKDHSPDTLLTFRHRYSFIARNENMYQDLGNMGTAMQHIFDRKPVDIGNRWGNTIFEPYIKRPNQIKYFNTISPFTDINVVIGGQGRSLLNIEFARNINPEWSFSFFYNTIVSNYVVYKTFQKNDNQLRHQTVGFVTRYFTPKKRYKMLAHFLYYNHKVDETAGLRTLKGVETGNDLFDVQPAEITTRFDKATVNNLQYGYNFHFLQQFSIVKSGLIELFHVLDWNKETRRYFDSKFQTNQNVYYDSTFFDKSKSTQSFYENVFSRFANKVGLKGRKGGFAYTAYLAARSYQYEAKYLKDSTVRDTLVRYELSPDAFVGGTMRYDVNEKIFVNVGYEKLLGKDFLFDAAITHPRFKLTHTRASYAPSAIEKRFFGNHYRWTTNFENTLFDQTRIASTLSFQDGKYIIAPNVNLTNYTNFIYFDTLAQVRQAKEKVTQWQAGLDFSFTKAPWTLKLKTIYTLNRGENLIRVPELFATGTAIYEKKAFNNALHYQMGLDVHFRSLYYADNFNPALGQFFLQDKELVGGFPIADFFFNFKIKRFMAFFKLNNLAQDVFSAGYFVTPFYMGQPRSLEIGINWMFFD